MEAKTMTTNLPIALWSGPRNVSTALMYSFANREAVKVFDEPFFGYFLAHTGVDRPSRVEVLETMETDFDRVEQPILALAKSQKLFLKNMANHLEGRSFDHLLKYRNVILVRRPDAVLSSYRQHIEEPTLLDLCYQHQVEILDFLDANRSPYFILDSDDIKSNPEKELRILCRFLGLPFSDRMLSWPAGPRKEDGVWAKYWYHNVHGSTGFIPFEDKIYQVPERLSSLLASCSELYRTIKQRKHE